METNIKAKKRDRLRLKKKISTKRYRSIRSNSALIAPTVANLIILFKKIFVFNIVI